MKCIVTKIAAVRPFGENLSIVTIDGVDNEVVANRREDGSFRWEAGQPCVYIPEDAVVPDDVLKERGYWNGDKGIGLLGGKKGNRVKGRNFGPEDDRFRSLGLLFKVEAVEVSVLFPDGLKIDRGAGSQPVAMGDDVADFFEITGP